jgi:hypothetical protein
MKAIYTIREYNKKTKEYVEIDYITAATQEEAKEMFLQKADWKPKKDTTLYIRIANCK